MEAVRSAFHAQLASVMDSLLAAAVCEIAKIFESSLCEQQAELAQRAEEISILRDQLEKVERRQKAKGGEVSEGHGEGGQQKRTPPGLNVEKDVSSISHPVGVISLLKEEVTGDDEAAIKHEAVGSHDVTDPNLSDQEHVPINGLSPTEAKAESLIDWDRSSPGGDSTRPLPEGSAAFLSISQSGRCSPRADPSLLSPGGWLPGLNAIRGAASGLEGLSEEDLGVSAPTGTKTKAEPTLCLQSGFGSDQSSNEDEKSGFLFLDQDPENQNSAPHSEHGSDIRPKGSHPDSRRSPSSVAVGRARDDKSARGSLAHTHHNRHWSERDRLRPEPNPSSLSAGHASAPVHSAAPGGGIRRPYSCPYCSKSFTYPSHQRRHLLRHTGVRLHSCQFCSKSFLTPSELTVHTRTHTGERPFGCTQCGKRFARSGNLRAHQRDVHMGKRPFVCAECGKRFAHRGNLRVHNHRVHQADLFFTDDPPQHDNGTNGV